MGCGWCSYEGGGVCLSGPGLCGPHTFTWTWEPDGCPGASGQQDAGGTPVPSGDGGSVVPEAGPSVPADAARDR